MSESGAVRLAVLQLLISCATLALSHAGATSHGAPHVPKVSWHLICVRSDLPKVHLYTQ